jgi:putative hemolysin
MKKIILAAALMITAQAMAAEKPIRCWLNYEADWPAGSNAPGEYCRFRGGSVARQLGCPGKDARHCADPGGKLAKGWRGLPNGMVVRAPR